MTTVAPEPPPSSPSSSSDPTAPSSSPAASSSASSSDSTVPPVTDSLADRFRDADGLALLLDFDGTLAPIVEEPTDAEIRPRARERLRELAAAEGIVVAVVSGRAAADVRDRVGVEGVQYVGNHGLERLAGDEGGRTTDGDGEGRAANDEEVGSADGDEVAGLASTEQRAAVEAACDRLAGRLADVAGATVERKGPTATVHYRRVAEERVPAVEAAVREVVGEHDRLVAVEGKAVLEIRPAEGPDKGDAADRLVESVVPDGERWLPVFVGDDEGDEPAFAAVEERGGVGVAVGRPETTAASRRLDDTDDVCALLGWLAESGRPLFGASNPEPG